MRDIYLQKTKDIFLTLEQAMFILTKSNESIFSDNQKAAFLQILEITA